MENNLQGCDPSIFELDAIVNHSYSLSYNFNKALLNKIIFLKILLFIWSRTLTTSAVGKSTGDVAGSAADRPSTAGVEISTDGQNQQQHKTFAAMLRNSKFVQMGDPVGKVCYYGQFMQNC